MSFTEANSIRHLLSADDFWWHFVDLDGRWRRVDSQETANTFWGRGPAGNRVSEPGDVFIHVETMDAGNGRRFLVPTFGRCSGSTVACIAAAESRLTEGASLILLPSGAAIEGIFVKDFDRDGDTDVLITLTTGAGILFESLMARSHLSLHRM